MYAVGQYVLYEGQAWVVSRVFPFDKPVSHVDLINLTGRRSTVEVSELGFVPYGFPGRDDFTARDSGDILCYQFLVQVGVLATNETLEDGIAYYNSLGDAGCEGCEFVNRCPVCIINE